jgi:hypothetical protein
MKSKKNNKQDRKCEKNLEPHVAKKIGMLKI